MLHDYCRERTSLLDSEFLLAELRERWWRRPSLHFGSDCTELLRSSGYRELAYAGGCPADESRKHFAVVFGPEREQLFEVVFKH